MVEKYKKLNPLPLKRLPHAQCDTTCRLVKGRSSNQGLSTVSGKEQNMAVCHCLQQTVIFQEDQNALAASLNMAIEGKLSTRE